LPPRVRSRVKDHLGAAHAVLRQVGRPRGWTLGPLQIAGGDSWQFALKPGDQGLRAALVFAGLLAGEEATLRTRIGLGVGPVSGDFSLRKLPGRSLETPHQLSGGQLEGLRAAGQSIGVAVDPQAVPAPVQPLLEAWGVWVSLASEEWTPGQRHAVAHALTGATQKTIAARLKTTQQTISKQLIAAQFSALRRALEPWEAAIAGLAEAGESS
jgi:hypothetical protein